MMTVYISAYLYLVLMLRHAPSSTLFPYTTLFRSPGAVRPRVRLPQGGRRGPVGHRDRGPLHEALRGRDRKSTRLNSSHSQISYAVFCLKKKNAIDGTATINSDTTILRSLSTTFFP